jgi:hypothetical protein
MRCAAPLLTRSGAALLTGVGTSELSGAATLPPITPHLKDSDSEASHRRPERYEEQKPRADWVWIGIRPNKAMIAPILKSRLFKYCFISLYVERLTFAAIGPTR